MSKPGKKRPQPKKASLFIANLDPRDAANLGVLARTYGPGIKVYHRPRVRVKVWRGIAEIDKAPKGLPVEIVDEDRQQGDA